MRADEDRRFFVSGDNGEVVTRAGAVHSLVCGLAGDSRGAETGHSSEVHAPEPTEISVWESFANGARMTSVIWVSFCVRENVGVIIALC